LQRRSAGVQAHWLTIVEFCETSDHQLLQAGKNKTGVRGAGLSVSITSALVLDQSICESTRDNITNILKISLGFKETNRQRIGEKDRCRASCNKFPMSDSIYVHWNQV